MKTLQSTLNKAIQRRARLSSITNAMRLVNGAGDDLDGLLIDRYNKHLHIQILKDHWCKQIDEICRVLTSSMPVDYLIVKTRDVPPPWPSPQGGGNHLCCFSPQGGGNHLCCFSPQGGGKFGKHLLQFSPIKGEEYKKNSEGAIDSRTIVEEHGIKFEVNLNDGLNCGLFLDMRQNRRMVGTSCKDKKVLNGFSYTCSFGVHARVGGAGQVINTDISRKILERGENNYQLNALSTAPGEFIKASSISFLQRAFKKGNGFDVIILDPPSFARYEAGVFQVKRDLPKLMALAVAVLNPGGNLLVTTNYSEITYADLERILSRGLNGRRVAHIQRVGQDEDFVGSNSFKESYMVGLWVKFL